jgi:predicted DNA-binding protein
MKKDTTMERVNTRVTPEQHKFIKYMAKQTKRTEGEIFRTAIDLYITKVKYNDDAKK